MPYGVRRRGSKHVVVNSQTGRVMGRHDSKPKADAQRRALRANEPGLTKRSGGVGSSAVDDVDFSIPLEVVRKAREGDSHYVTGWALVSKDERGRPFVDLGGDHVPIEELQKAARAFMKNSRQVGDMHVGGAVGTVVESVVFTHDLAKALRIPEGSTPEGWLVTMEVPQANYDAVDKGDRLQLSIQGRAGRRR